MRSFARRALACLGALMIALTSSSAVAALRVKWDCYLPNAGVDCAVLENSLTSKIPFLRVVSRAGDADVVVTLTSVPAENSTRFRLDLVGPRIDGYSTEVHTTDKIPSSIDAATATVRILTKLERGLDDFMDQKVAAEAKDGKLSIELVDPVELPYTGRPEQAGIRWYAAPSVGTYVSDVQGVGINASGSASLSFNYSAPKWRAQQWIGATYSQQSQPVPGTAETASISFAGANAANILSWSLTRDNRWSVGLLFLQRRTRRPTTRCALTARPGSNSISSRYRR